MKLDLIKEKKNCRYLACRPFIQTNCDKYLHQYEIAIFLSQHLICQTETIIILTYFSNDSLLSYFSKNSVYKFFKMIDRSRFMAT